MSPLWNKSKNKQLITFLRRPSLKQDSDYHIFAHKHFPLFKSVNCGAIKGISLFISRNKQVEGGMTVEAAILLPLFLFFFLNLGCAIELIRLHGNFQFALTDIGNRMSIYGHALADDAQESELKDIIVSYAYVRKEILEYLGKEYLEEAPLSGGVFGVHLWESEIFDGNDYIDVIVTYEAEPLIKLMGFNHFRMYNRYYGHVWNGYEIPQDEEMTERIYVAENGVVYHENEECTHLFLTVKSVSVQEAYESRNANGQKYTPCQRCCGSASAQWVYITEDGDNIHYMRNCPGLKRTVYELAKEKAKNYKPCSRCVEN